MNSPRTVLPVADEVAKTFIVREIGAEVDIESSQIVALRTNLLLWYRANRRLLPWRGDKINIPDSSLEKPTTLKINDAIIVQKEGQNSSTVTFERSAYGTWISEIMLQQTRVETVIPYWLKWMARFPSIEVLASASGVLLNPILHNSVSQNHDFSL
jgi:A/G-specific adenine glycosylase